jgi:hypothetical protein
MHWKSSNERKKVVEKGTPLRVRGRFFMSPGIDLSRRENRAYAKELWYPRLALEIS